eukprot:5368600-Amphidinium_carterae.1
MDAIVKIQADSLFWVREVYEHIRGPPQSIPPPAKRAKFVQPAASMSPKGASKGKAGKPKA